MLDTIWQWVRQHAGQGRLLPSLRALLQSLPRLTVVVTVLSVAAGLLPAAFALVTGVLVGAVPHALSAGLGSPASRPVVTALVAMAVLLLAGDVLAAAQSALMPVLAACFSRDVRSRALAAVQRPTGIGHLEEPALLEALSRVRAGMTWDAGDLVLGGAPVLTRLAQGLASAALVATFHWWAAVLLAVTWLAAWASAVRVVTGGLFDQLAALLRAWYLRGVATQPAEAKEVRLFGLHPWLLRRYTDAWRAASVALWRSGRRDRRAAATWLAVVTAAHALVFAILAHAAVAGHLSLARVAILVQAILAMAALGEVGGETQVENGLRVVVPVLALERTLAAQALAGGGATADGLPASAIRFEGVRFRYPGRAQDALAGLDLEIPAGRSLAIVGANGAGKTTLVKLLARLYDPDAGRITVDERDLRTLDPAAWRRRLAAVFQDFVHYELSAVENVGFGASGCQDDRDALHRAAARAGARDLIERLPHGWETVLSPRYAGGVDLSGGEWQRIALARALFAVEAGASVLILDEPTAALDVRAEADLFDRFLLLTRGLTTIVVSHRFSTVRRADRIVVLEGGRIVEAGAHDALLAAGGRYARMFALQADRFGPVAVEKGGDGDA